MKIDYKYRSLRIAFKKTAYIVSFKHPVYQANTFAICKEYLHDGKTEYAECLLDIWWPDTKEAWLKRASK